MAETVLQPGHLPLYAQVRDILAARIVSGDWKPGQLIPNEFRLADELGVSQGTVRKALDMMATQQLLVRRQGRGTFVLEHTPTDVLFRYFQLYERNGDRATPDSVGTRTQSSKASPQERHKLELETGARVLRVHRVRTVHGQPMISETITVPSALFPGIEKRADIPNTLYDLYQQDFGVTVTNADERLTAVAATPDDAALLNIEPGAPLLEIDRLAFGADGAVVEWRVSRCETSKISYLCNLR